MKLSEKDFLGQVIDLAHIFGWRVAHFRPAKTERGWRTAVQADGAGFPDLVMTRKDKGMCYFIELKSSEGKLSPEQEEWVYELQVVAENSLGVCYFCWKPGDFDEIKEALR